MRLLTFLVALCFSTAALAQSLNTPVFQTGTITPRHGAMWTTNGVIQDAGPAGGGAPGVGLSELNITNTGTPFCINDQAVTSTGGYHQLCIGALALGGGLISYQALGGATQLGLACNINGTTFPCFPSGGNVTGPTSPFPTVGNAVIWNGSTTVKDAGAPPVLTVSSNAALKALTGLNSGAVVFRQAFWPGVTGGAASYTFTSANCASPDNGFEVAPSSGSGCFLVDLSGGAVNPMLWGATGSATTETVACTVTNNTITIGSAGDFLAGQAVALQGCGTAYGGLTPAAPTVGTPTVTGNLTACYRIEAYTSTGAVSATSPNACVSDLPGASITAASWATGDVTFTTSVAHNISVGEGFVIKGMTPTTYNGNYKAISGTTGSTLVATLASNPGTATGFGTLVGLGFPFDTNNLNQSVPLSWSSVSGAAGYVVLKGASSGAETPIAVTTQTSFNDYGDIQTMPFWIPTTVGGLSSSQSSILKTTLVSIGTTTAQIAVNASSSGGGTMTHDDTTALTSALTSTQPISIGCGTFNYYTGLTISNSGQSLRNENVGCTTLKPAGTFDALTITGSNDRIGNLTIDGTNTGAGWCLNFNSDNKTDATGPLYLVDCYNGLIIQNGSTGDHLTRVHMNVDIRGQNQMLIQGTDAAPTSLMYIDFWQSAVSYTAQCIDIDGRVASIFGKEWTCQRSPGDTNGQAEFEVSNSTSSAVGMAFLNLQNLALNECPDRCGSLGLAQQSTIYRVFSQASPGNAADNWSISTSATNTKFIGGDIFGADLNGIDNKGFVTELVNMNVYANSQATAGASDGIACESGANGMAVIGGSDYALTAGATTTPQASGVHLKAGCLNYSVSGGLWVGRTAPIWDQASPNPAGNSTISGLPYGSPPTTTVIGSGGQTWAAATYPALYSCNGVAVLARSGTVGNPFTDTTDTAANIVAAMPVQCRVVGQTFHIRVVSISGGIMTVSGGAGVTVGGIATIPAGTSTGMAAYADFVGMLTNVGSGTEAVTLHGCSQTAGQAC